MLQAFDINAACSGYLYALQSGYDFLQSTPQGRVLVVTAEVLSPLVDRDDFDTAILFGDAAIATIAVRRSALRAGGGPHLSPRPVGQGRRRRTLSRAALQRRLHSDARAARCSARRCGR